MSTNSACCASFWTKEENKAFENALAIYGDVDKWENIAAAIPGKSLEDIKNHYTALVEDITAIEAGLVPPPNYASSSQVSSNQAGGVSTNIGGNQTGQAQSDPNNENRSVGTIVERKRGRPWTEEEHWLFLQGLEKYGKGDWRSISRNYVVSRTPTQVASHAQKYFKRSQSDNQRRRSSIHDITGVDNGMTSAGQRPVAEERSEVAQVETMSDTSASHISLFIGQLSGASGIDFTSDGTSQQLPASAQMIEFGGVDFTGGKSIPEMPLTTQPTGPAAAGPVDYADGIEFISNRASEQLPVSGQTIGLAGGTSIPQMPLTAKPTGATAVASVDYNDCSEFTSNRVVSGQNIGLAGSLWQMTWTAQPCQATAVGPTNYSEGIGFTSNTACQLPFTTIGLAGGTSIPQMPLIIQPTGAIAGPIDYADGVELTTNTASQQLSTQMIGLAGGTSIPQIPFTVQPSVTAEIGPTDYTQSLIPSSIAGISMGFPPTTSLPIQRSVTSTVGMPVSLPSSTSMMYGVTQTPYGLFIPHPPVNVAPMTYPMQPSPHQNP